MSDFPIINDTPYKNTFTTLCVGLTAVWIASIFVKKNYYKEPIHERSQNKRYMIKQQTKLNRNITHLNRNNKSLPMLNNYFSRHSRFNNFK